MADLGDGIAIVVPIGRLRPNDWNPNVQPDWVYQKELGSIRRYGFVDPLIVREAGVEQYEIIDGFHRWKAADELGYTELPCWNLGEVSDADARELTVILNETRGQPNQDRLRELLQDLIKRRGDEDVVRDIMPFSRERFDEIIGRARVDWDALEERRQQLQTEGRWKEIVLRMPYEAAHTVEQAMDEVRQREGLAERWEALEMICAEAIA